MKNFEIVDNYHILHFDDYPILFIGSNAYGNIVVGSFLFEDENENLKYLYSIVPNVVAINFLNEHISYLDLLKKAVEIYVVTRDYNNLIKNHIKVNFNEIDPEILPLETAFCPPVDEKVKNMFGNDYLVLFTAKYIELDSIDSSIFMYRPDVNVSSHLDFKSNAAHRRNLDLASVSLAKYKSSRESLLPNSGRIKKRLSYV